MKHFFDIGANNGSTFDRFLLKTNEFDNQKVWCFEPSPRSWPALIEKAEAMATRFKVTLCPFGFGLTGAFPFYQQQHSEGDTFCAELTAFNGEFPVKHIPSYSILATQFKLSEFILKQTWIEDKITLKLDCEGSEFVILKDLLKSEALGRCERIMVEWHRVRNIDYQDEQESLSHAFAEMGHPIELWPY